jgi:hypothetical protein
MWNRRVVASGALAAAVAFLGACSETPPIEPLADPSGTADLFAAPLDPAVGYAQSHDVQLARINEEVPGFGGYFYDDNMVLNVYMKGAVQAREATTLRARLAPFGIELDAQPMRVVAADYTFAELHNMHRRIQSVHSIPRVVFTDVDDARNRVAIAVEDDAAERQVRSALAVLDVPMEMIRITRAEPVRYMQTLQQRVRPVAGGLQINFISGGSGFVCTLGANVRSPEAPNVHGFITNSHCTSNQWDGAAGQSQYAQPSGVGTCPGGANCIGQEQFDAPFFTSAQNPICPAGRRCRFSDAAGALYAPDIENLFARVYRTTGVNSLTIDQTNPFYNIVEEAPSNVAVGDSVFKVGRTTGFTRGRVTSSCANFNIGTQDHYLCHDFVTGPTNSVGGGDSGSSTWSRAPAGQTQNVRINGLLCCGSGSTVFIHSPMSGIRTDSPPPPGRTWRAHQPL